jgi:hypothetical protein
MGIKGHHSSLLFAHSSVSDMRSRIWGCSVDLDKHVRELFVQFKLSCRGCPSVERVRPRKHSVNGVTWSVST